MHVSQRGLYALQALTVLARRPDEIVKIKTIAAEEHLPEKFLEAILLELKRARIVVSLRGANGGYQLKRAPRKISLGEVIRRIDGPLAPYEDFESLRRRVNTDRKHRPLFQVLLDVRNATAGILDYTFLSDLCCSSRN
ncbi:MAG TPA: Rrf2 family transcriptional regulator [Candidatus Acidoferrales bacterium]